MLASHAMRIMVLLAAVALSACSEHSSTSEPTVDSIPAYTPPAVRTTTADLKGDLGVATGAATAPSSRPAGARARA